MQAMPQAQASLSIPACSTFSSLLSVLTHRTKKRLHYTLNTLHPTIYNTLTTHSKHAKCHKSLNSQNLLSITVIVVPFSSNRNVFSCLQTLPACGHCGHLWTHCFFLHQTQSKRDSNVREKPWQTFLGEPTRLSTQEVRPGGGLAASYTRTSTDSDSSLLSLCIQISSDPNRLGPNTFSLINPQQSV